MTKTEVTITLLFMRTNNTILRLLYFLSPFLLSSPLFASSLSERNQSFLQELQALIQLREHFSESLNGYQKPITPDVFKAVCGTVGGRLYQWSNENNASVQQITSRYRNPAHKASEEDEKILNLFRKEKQKTYHLSEKKTEESQVETLYVPIYVQSSCLNCHGRKEKRPLFIKKSFPNDLAHSFKKGDLRGAIKVELKTPTKQSL